MYADGMTLLYGFPQPPNDNEFKANKRKFVKLRATHASCIYTCTESCAKCVPVHVMETYEEVEVDSWQRGKGNQNP